MGRPQTLPQRARIAEELATDAAAVVVCGGVGLRFGREGGKSLVPLCGLPLVAWAVVAAASAPSVGLVVVVCRAEDEPALVDALCGLPLVGNVLFARSGRTRQASVASGLSCVGDDYAYVCVQDGARPLVRPEAFERTLAELRADPSLSGAIAGYPATDTIKTCERALVVGTPDRSQFWCVQTPQSFVTAHLRRALAAAQFAGWDMTDDAGVVERWGGRVRCVTSARDNIKVTVPQDLEIARAILEARLATEWSAEA